MTSSDRISRLRRSMRTAVTARPVAVPDGYKASSTEKRAAQLLIELRERNGEDVPDSLRVTAQAPLRGRVLSGDEKVSEMETALHDLRADAGACSDESEKRGLLRACETMRAALAGER